MTEFPGRTGVEVTGRLFSLGARWRRLLPLDPLHSFSKRDPIGRQLLQWAPYRLLLRLRCAVLASAALCRHSSAGNAIYGEHWKDEFGSSQRMRLRRFAVSWHLIVPVNRFATPREPEARLRRGQSFSTPQPQVALREPDGPPQ